MNEADHRELVSGSRKGLQPALLRAGLTVLGWGYGWGTALRNQAYERHWLRSVKVSRPVISIGNLTTGGTGKTPFAAWLAQWFRNRGIRVAFLSRGYGADPGAVNDEALVLQLHCPDVPHLQNPDRVASAHIAIEELESQLLILDDGFQHRRLQRDLDIVLIDATNPWGYGQLLPRGLLRESPRALRRAGLVVMTRADAVAADQLQAIRQQIQRIRGSSDLVEVQFPARRLVTPSGEQAPLSAISRQKIAAFCGIGNPATFLLTLRSLGAIIDETSIRTFPDHYRYRREDVDDLQNWVRQLGCVAVVTTQKDLVKLELDQLAGRPLWALEIGTEIVAGDSVLERELSRIAECIPADEFADGGWDQGE